MNQPEDSSHAPAGNNPSRWALLGKVLVVVLLAAALAAVLLHNRSRTRVAPAAARPAGPASTATSGDADEAQKARAADNPLDRALATGRPVLADFGRGRCIPCKMMKPILDELKEHYKGKAEILILDIDQYPDLTRRVGIRAIPTQIFYDAEGREISRHLGFLPREAIVERLREMGVE